jgi:hypothetical protein
MSGKSCLKMTLNKPPKKKAAAVEERVITLYGILKSGVGK